MCTNPPHHSNWSSLVITYNFMSYYQGVVLFLNFSIALSDFASILTKEAFDECGPRTDILKVTQTCIYQVPIPT